MWNISFSSSFSLFLSSYLFWAASFKKDNVQYDPSLADSPWIGRGCAVAPTRNVGNVKTYFIIAYRSCDSKNLWFLPTLLIRWNIIAEYCIEILGRAIDSQSLPSSLRPIFGEWTKEGMTSRGICWAVACQAASQPAAPNDMDNGIRFWSEWNQWMAGPKSEDNFSLSAFLLQLPLKREGRGRVEVLGLVSPPWKILCECLFSQKMSQKCSLIS